MPNPAHRPREKRRLVNPALPPEPAPEYSPDQLACPSEEFIIPATDDHGHTSKEYVRLQPTVDRAMQILIEKHIFPYDTKSDIIRHAVHRHMPWLEAKAEMMDKSVPLHFFACCEMIITTLQDSEFNQRMEKTFKAMHEKIGGHIDRGELPMAIHLLNKARTQMNRMEDSPWKTKFKKLFGDRYSHLLKASAALPPGVRVLKPGEPDETKYTETIETVTSTDEDDSDQD